MRFVFTLEQRDFFRKNHFIEFEGMLSSKQAALIDKEAQELLSGRLRTPFSQWDTLPPLALYKAGFDLWREALAIRKATQKLPIVHIASELFDTAPLRIAFDQFCLTSSPHPPFQKSFSLTEISSIKPLAGGILFLLEDLSDDVLQKTAFPLPKKAGNALFLSADFPIPWPMLFAIPGLHVLFVAFAPEKSFYRQEPNDPHSPLFKKQGYVFNDQLKEELHPLLYGKK